MLFPAKFGTCFLGKKEIREDLSFITTKWFSVLYMPLIPLGTFRVLKEKEGLLLTEYQTEKAEMDWGLTMRIGLISILSFAALMAIFYGIFMTADHFNQPKLHFKKFVPK